MDWFKTESRYYDDIALVQAGEAAEVLFMRANGWSTDAETYGFIPGHQLARFGLRGGDKRAAALVRENLWVKVPGGWRIRSYERIQEEMLRIVRRKKAEADRKRKAYYEKQGFSADNSADTPQETPHGSPDDSRKSPSLVSGNESGLEVETEIGEFPPNPRRSGGRRCTRHGRPRKGCADCSMPANATILDPPCGSCSPSRRLEDDQGNDLGPCPNCHPGRRTA